MRFLFIMAFKNITRYTRRTLITAVSIAVGLGLYVMTDALLTGAFSHSEANIIWLETGSARVRHREFVDKDYNISLSKAVETPAPILRELDAMGYAATPRIDFTGEVIIYKDPYPEDGSLPVRLAGIDPETDPTVFRLKEPLKKGGGRWLRPGTDDALIGGQLAKNLNAEIGYPLRILTSTKDGYRQTFDLTVVGILDSEDPVVDRTTVYLPIDTASDALEMNGAVTSVSIHYGQTLDQDAEAAEIAAELRRKIPGPMTDLGVPSWREMNKDYVALVAAEKGGSFLMIILVLAVAAVGITNTMMMAIYERMYETAMLRAMGMKSSEIFWTFLIEAGAIGLVGSVIGLGLGVAGTWPLVVYGIDYSFIAEQADMGYRTTGIMRAAWHPVAFGWTIFFGVSLSMLVALIPIRRAVKKPIVAGLREGKGQ